MACPREAMAECHTVGESGMGDTEVETQSKDTKCVQQSHVCDVYHIHGLLLYRKYIYVDYSTHVMLYKLVYVLLK